MGHDPLFAAIEHEVEKAERNGSTIEAGPRTQEAN